MHKIRKKYFLAGTSIVVMLIGLFVLAPIFFVSGAQSTGGNILIGDSSPTGEMASFEDKVSGMPYEFRLIASEEDNAGVGRATLYLVGPALTLCTANGSSAIIDGVIPGSEQGPYDDHYFGNNPLANIACGTAYGMAVSINGCQANIEFHGYVHSDYPWVTYMGMMTTDVKVKFGGGQKNNTIDILISTPKETIKLKGKIEGDYVMDTCPQY